MRRLLRILSTLCLVSLASVVQPPIWFSSSAASTKAESLSIGQPKDNVVMLWHRAALQGVRESGMGTADGGAGSSDRAHVHIRRLGRL